MQKKKIRRAEEITEGNILSLYDRVLPLFYDNPLNLDPVKEFFESLQSLISFDNYHFVLDDARPQTLQDKLLWTLEVYPQNSDIRINHSKNIPDAFDHYIESGYKTVTENARKKYPDKYPHYYQIISGGVPKIAFGFFRFGNTAQHKKFTTQDKEVIEKISKHIFTLLRTILLHLRDSPTIDYHATFLEICSSIGSDYNLSERETLLLPEIIFGMTNEDIARKNFVTVAAIKKHIKNILKKTGSKNRIDFIGKFFISLGRSM